MRKLINYFSKFELILWLTSVVMITASFAIFDRENYLTLIASVIGVSAIILNAKGNPLGQVLMIIFSLLYGIISLSFSYFGEMITYLGMTMPMAAIALGAWLKNPFNGNKAQVKVNKIHRKEVALMLILSLVVTVVFFFILKAFGTANLLPSALSVTTSFIAVYLTFRRSPWFSLAYGANDIVLIILWVLAAFQNPSYISVAVCFAMFLLNDIYAFISWLRMEKLQTGVK